MTNPMGPGRPKWKAGKAHKFFIRCFRFATAPGPAFRCWNGGTNPLIALGFGNHAPKLILRCTKPSGVPWPKISLANFSSEDSLTGRAEVVPVCKESRNGLENTEDRRSAVRHGNQHVCERDPQVTGQRTSRISTQVDLPPGVS